MKANIHQDVVGLIVKVAVIFQNEALLFSLEQQPLMNRSLRPGTFVNVNKVSMFHVDFKCSMASSFFCINI